MRQYFVHIMRNGARALSVGMTNDLERHVSQHKHRLTAGFTQRYTLDRLVYFEVTSDVRAAIEREKVIKGWARAKKLALVASTNPTWRDLSLDWDQGARVGQSVDSSQARNDMEGARHDRDGVGMAGRGLGMPGTASE